MTQRGFFAIGIEHAKTEYNVGTLWRTAYSLGAAFIFTVGARYRPQAPDTVRSWTKIPLFNFASLEDLRQHLPYACRIVGIENDDDSTPIHDFMHPETCAYLLGAEDHGLTKAARRACHAKVILPGAVCHNVAVAGALVMFDRLYQ